MGNLFQKPTQDEVKTIRQARIDYQDYLSKTETNTNADVTKEAITPETAQGILTKVKEAYDWLQKNPNANLNEVLTNQDATTEEIKRILSTDVPKREILNMTIAIPAAAELFQQQGKVLNDEQVTQLKELATSEKRWYNNNASTATLVDFSQEKIKINDKIVEIIKRAEIVGPFKERLEAAMRLNTNSLISAVAQQQAQVKRREAQEVDIGKGVSTALTTAAIVFLCFLGLTLCIYSGSLAANFAIGRAPAYRILYFIYGFMPIFAPFVLLYAIYKRIKEGPFTQYAILPVSLEPATTRLGKFLWFPFYWIPDDAAIKAADAFQASLEAMKVV